MVLRWFAFFVILLLNTSVNASGLFDFLDPCIAAKSDYWQAREAVFSELDREKAAVANEQATPSFRDFWWKEKKKILLEFFEQNYGDVVRASGGNYNRAFEIWLAKMVKQQGGMNGIDPIIQIEYKKTKRLALDKKRGATQTELDAQKSKLYGGCPQDVGNQVFRGAVTILVAPVNIIKGNFEAANRESGDIDKLLREITGVSVGDIKSDGVCGGDNSEMRKVFGSLC